MRVAYGQVALVDNGGFFPEENIAQYQDVAWFLMDAMKALGVDAIGVGERDLRFGRAFLEQRAKRDQLPMVCANLLDKKSQRTVFAPYVVKKVGAVTVGFFGLIYDKANLGPGKDSLAIDDPTAVARRVIPEMRKKGAQVVVLLSQLGKVESEDLVTAVDGVDALMVGRNVALVDKGRMVKNTVACYGGEQGQYACRTIITLDDKKHMSAGDADAIILSPEVGEKAEVHDLVKSFEDGFTERMRKTEMERQAKETAQRTDNSPSHFVGDKLCVRCHQKEGEQWKTTSHAVAFQTLVDMKKDTDRECIGCHVVGFEKSGGFTTINTTPDKSNVQCESCHGMGTEHDAFAKSPQRITAQTCMQCHTKDNDPGFVFDQRLALVAHSNLSGATLNAKKVKGPADAKAAPAMKGHTGQ
jgi:hypothetical protein